MGRPPCCERDGLKRGPWTPDEDKKLVDYISKNGHGSWRTLPKNAGLERCGKSCRLRWINYLRPDIKRGRITAEEDEVIIKLQAVLGNKWSVIASMLPGRTDNEIKNYWNTHIRKRLALAHMAGIDPVTHAPLVPFDMAFVGAGGAGGCLQFDHRLSTSSSCSSACSLLPNEHDCTTASVALTSSSADQQTSLGRCSRGAAVASDPPLGNVNPHELLRFATNIDEGRNSVDYLLALQKTAATVLQQQQLQQNVHLPFLSHAIYDDVLIQNSYATAAQFQQIPSSSSATPAELSTATVGALSAPGFRAHVDGLLSSCHDDSRLYQSLSDSEAPSLPDYVNWDPTLPPFNLSGGNFNSQDSINRTAFPVGCNFDGNLSAEVDSAVFNGPSLNNPNNNCSKAAINSLLKQSPARAMSRTTDSSPGSQIDGTTSATASCTTYLNSSITEDERDSFCSVEVKEAATFDMTRRIPGLLDPSGFIG